MSVFSVLALIGPLLLLATTVVWLWSYGPVGWLASVALVLFVVGTLWWGVRRTRRWWRGTKAPVRAQTRPSEARRAPR